MLDQIKSLLSDKTIQPFTEFYDEYVMRVQDDLLSKEMLYLQQHNVLDPKSLEQLIALSYDKHGGKLA